MPKENWFGFPGELLPPLALNQLVLGKWVSQAIAVAAELDVADRLAAGARTSADSLELREGAPCRRACARRRDGRPPPGEKHFAKLLDLEMMVITDRGRERTEEEYAALFRASGLRPSRVVPTASPVSIVEAVRD